MSNWLKNITLSHSSSSDARRRIWHKIDSSQFNHLRRSDSHSYWQFSPYDVPTIVSGEFDDKNGTVIVSFGYINDEPTNRVDLHDFAFDLGKHSNRVYRIRARKRVGKSGIAAALSQALDRLSEDRSKQVPPDGYKIAKSIIADAGERLFDKDLVDKVE